MPYERLSGEEQYRSKNYLLEMPRAHANLRLKGTPQKLNFFMSKAIQMPFDVST